MKDYGQIAGIKGHVSDMLETVYNKGYAQGCKDCETNDEFYKAQLKNLQHKIENTGIQLKYMDTDDLFYTDEQHPEVVYKTAIMQLRNNLVRIYEMTGGELENG